MEKVKVGAFPEGTAFGAYIYSINVNVGQAGDPSTVELELINSDGVYNINDNHLINSADNPVTIRIDAADSQAGFINGVATTALHFRTMYLVSFNQNQSTTQKTLSVKYVDGGCILDKIQVAILNKQASPANIFGPGGIGTWVGHDVNWYGATTLHVRRTYNLPVSCLNPCPNTTLPAWGPISANPWPQGVFGSYGQPLGFGRANLNPPYVFEASKCAVTNVTRDNLSRGGIVVIGEEEFVSSSCQIPNVTYTFYELMQLLTSPIVGLKMRNWTDRNGFSAGRPENAIRESFSGSLKDVLNNWCSVYGLGYNWDFFKDEIVFYDVTQPVRNLEAVYEAVTNINENSGGYGPIAISDITRSSSIEGTYHQDDISTYLKPAKKKVIQQSYTQRVFFEPVTLNHIIPYEENSPDWNLLTGGRTAQELIISSVLAKYNENARTLYNYFLIASNSNDFSDNIDLMGRPLGLNIKHKLTAQEKADLISYTFNTKDYVANNKKYGKDAGCYLGTYSKEAESKWIAWERKIADFIGRYYIFPEFNSELRLRNFNMQVCFDRDVETKPATKLYTKKQTVVAPTLTNTGNTSGLGNTNTITPKPNYYADDLPFNDLLKHPNGAVLTKMVHHITKEPINKFRLFDRNASYGMKEEHYEPLFFKNSQEVLKDYIPTFAELDSNQKTFLHELLKHCFPDVYNKLEQIENDDKKPNLLFFPARSVVLEALDVSNLHGVPGIDLARAGDIFGRTASPPNKFNSAEFKPTADAEAENVECNLACDWDITNLLCDCPDGDQYDPDKVGLTSQMARWFKVIIGDNNADFILPSEFPYSAFVTLNTKLQKTEPGIRQNFGILRNAKGTMGYRVNFRDITSDIESMDKAQDGKTGGNVMAGNQGQGQIEASVLVPGKGWMAARNYHTAVTQNYTNNLVNQNLSFTMVGLDWTPLMGFINVESGLSGLQISYSEEGMTINFEYSTRPPELLNPDDFMAKIGPRLNANSYMRTF
tara:strand:- start:5304 stop:8279 length:2976 start_codon:yes stop_codon:yes gene_type:complete